MNANQNTGENNINFYWLYLKMGNASFKMHLPLIEPLKNIRTYHIQRSGIYIQAVGLILAAWAHDLL